MSLLQNSNAISAGGYDLTNSLRFRASASAYLKRTPSASGNQQTWTWSGWVKRGALGSSQQIFASDNSSTSQARLNFTASDTLSFLSYIGAFQIQLVTTQVFRDPSAWYHIVLVLDTTNATASNRTKIYINGAQVTAFGTATYSAQNYNGVVNSNLPYYLGTYFNAGSGEFLDGYMEEINFIDGQALTPSSFGETDPVTGSWVAKKYTGTYGINGFYLPFSDTDSNENLLLYSEQFDNATWVKAQGTVTANAAVSPDGTTTADKFTPNTTGGVEHLFFQQPLIKGDGVYTATVYAKAAGYDYFGIRIDDSVIAHIQLFNLNTGVATGSAYNITSSSITSVGNGWYRCSITFPVSGIINNFVLYPFPTDSLALYAGNGTSGCHVWGAQLSYGATTKRYIATTTAAVTNQGTVENLHPYSEQFDNAGWTKGASTVTANSVVAPNGTTTADTLIDNTTSDQHLILQAIATPVIGDIYTMSIYAKANTRSQIGLTMHGEAAASFDLTAGTVLSSGGFSNVGIQSMGNGWYRCYVTITKTNTSPNVYYIIYKDGVNPYLGTGTGSIYIWGAQISKGYTLGPYLPTVASAQSLVHRLGADRSLGSTSFGYNSWIPNNISLTLGTTYDAMTDVPTNTSATVANYAVLNPLKMPAPASVSYTNGNLSVSCGNGNQTPALVTIYPSSGKWYWEVIWTSGSFARVGVQNTNVASTDFAADTAGWRWESNTGNIYNGSTLATVSTYATNDVLGFCLDCDAGKLYVSKNGTWQNSAVPASGTGAVATNIPTSTLMSPAVATGSGTSVFTFNAGQRPFSYTPPTGFKALNTYNLPDSTILKGSRYMDAVRYTGTGANLTISTNNIDLSTNGLLWIKSRSTAEDNLLVDSVRTYDGTKYWQAFFSNSTAGESGYGGSDNVVPGSYRNIAGGVIANVNGTTYVQWLWQAGSAAASSNTSGSITSTVSANPTAGFSIVTYTGTGSAASIGHGLGVTPEFIMVKRRDTSANWMVVSKYLSNYNWYLKLNLTDAQVGDATIGNIDPTPTTFNVGTNAIDNASGGTYVAYVFAPIAGFSKFGSYTGNGSTDGPFVYLGFRPKFVLIKNISSTYSWWLVDTARDPINLAQKTISPNSSGAESANEGIDILSNGFKARANGQNTNNNGSNYIYMAFAENPFKNSNAR
jgi:hypothetical protein